MRIIAVMSPKGGIGKTTTADSIAYILGEECGKRVLVIDGDPQGDTSKIFGAYEPDGIGLDGLLARYAGDGEYYHTTDFIRTTRYEHIDIIPANEHLIQTDMDLMFKKDENQVTRLRGALAEVFSIYDYCICDCGRLFDMVVINIMLSASLVIAPVKVGGFENEALHNLEEQIEDMKEINAGLDIKVIMTMLQKNKTSMEMESWLRSEYGQNMFVTPVRRSVIVEKSSMAMQPLPEFSRRGIVTQDYREIVEEIIREA
jgi:chromosome partitioning protein